MLFVLCAVVDVIEPFAGVDLRIALVKRVGEEALVIRRGGGRVVDFGDGGVVKISSIFQNGANFRVVFQVGGTMAGNVGKRDTTLVDPVASTENLLLLFGRGHFCQTVVVHSVFSNFVTNFP